MVVLHTPHQELQSAVHAAGGSGPVQRTYFEVLEAVVSEFSLATASALGLAWEVHERCRLELEVRKQAGRHNYVHDSFEVLLIC